MNSWTSRRRWIGPRSQRRTIGPCRWRSRCWRKRRTSKPLKLRVWRRTYKARRRRLGERASALMAEMWPGLYQYRAYGVWPLGAHDLLRFGMRRNPLSSRNARCAPSWSAFFYMRPAIPLPMGDGLFVPLQRSALRLLTAPAQCPQQLPDMSRVVGHLVVLLDHSTDPCQCPQVGGVSRGQCALQEQPYHAPLLGGR